MEPSLPGNGCPVVVMGMHRSGTSLVARILSELGVHMGNPLDTHHESICFKNINKQLLSRQGAHWARPGPFVSHLDDEDFVEENARLAGNLFDLRMESYGRVRSGQGWGWKDPRNTLTLPVWLKIFPEAKIIHVLRNGIDVALSLHRRELRRIIRLCWGRSEEEPMLPPTIVMGYHLWERYLRLGQALQARCANWLSLRYEEVISQPGDQMAVLCKFLGIESSPDAQPNSAERIVRQPTQRSTFDQLRVRGLFRMGLLDPQLLLALGYDLPQKR